MGLITPPTAPLLYLGSLVGKVPLVQMLSHLCVLAICVYACRHADNLLSCAVADTATSDGVLIGNLCPLKEEYTDRVGSDNHWIKPERLLTIRHPAIMDSGNFSNLWAFV